MIYEMKFINRPVKKIINFCFPQHSEIFEFKFIWGTSIKLNPHFGFPVDVNLQLNLDRLV